MPRTEDWMSERHAPWAHILKTTKMKTIRVTDEQMFAIHKHLFEHYPWLHRNNEAYTAELVSAWDLTYDERFEKDILDIINKNVTI